MLTGVTDGDGLPAGIGRPATGALALAGYTRLEQLTRITEREVLALHGVGPKAVRILRERLSERGLAFRDS
jgi:predicted flap endonuclease-1-like 5' DNA nuclease